MITYSMVKEAEDSLFRKFGEEKTKKMVATLKTIIGDNFLNYYGVLNSESVPIDLKMVCVLALSRP